MKNAIIDSFTFFNSNDNNIIYAIKHTKSNKNERS